MLNALNGIASTINEPYDYVLIAKDVYENGARPVHLLAALPLVSATALKCATASGKTVAKSGETAATAAGRAAHKDWKPPPGFQKEYRLPSGRRADAVNPTTREVIELKPDNPRAIRDGKKQVEGYVQELEQLTGQKWTGRVETYRR